MYQHTKPGEPTKQGHLLFVLFESPITSVSTVSRGHPTLVSWFISERPLFVWGEKHTGRQEYGSGSRKESSSEDLSTGSLKVLSSEMDQGGIRLISIGPHQRVRSGDFYFIIKGRGQSCVRRWQFVSEFPTAV